MQLGFYFDQTRCTGCYACSVACKDWNDIPAGPARWMRILYNEEGKYPNVFVSHLAVPCYHCAEPACVLACPVDAISKRESDGIVVVDRDKCLGCGLCAATCPTEAIRLIPRENGQSPFNNVAELGAAILTAKGKEPLSVRQKSV